MELQEVVSGGDQAPFRADGRPTPAFEPPRTSVLLDLGEDPLDHRLPSCLETGVHRNYIGGIERGERSPSVAAIITLADALRVPLADLFRQAEQHKQ